MVKIELKNLKISEILVTVYHIYRKEISSFWKIQTGKKKRPDNLTTQYFVSILVSINSYSVCIYQNVIMLHTFL